MPTVEEALKVHQAKRLKEIESDYKLALDVLQAMATRDILAAWKGVDGENWSKAKPKLIKKFSDIVALYGEQARASSADCGFLRRSLDEDLSLMAYPALTEPVDREWAKKSARWALRKVTAEQKRRDVKAAKKNLEQISKRLILPPVRKAINQEAAKENELPRLSHKQKLRREKWGFLKRTRVLSLPSPGACAWCLLIASKGEVFHADGVGGYHDGCRCVPLLTRDGEPYPAIIRQIELMQGQAQELAGYEEAMAKFRAQHPDATQWQVWHKELDFAVNQQQRYLREFQEFPPIPGITIPDIDFTTVTYRDLGGELRTIDVPMILQFAGHVLYGWKAEETELKLRMLTRCGHVGKSEVGVDKALFRGKWNDQRVFDGVYEALADQGDWVANFDNGRIKIMKEVAVPAPELMNEEKARNRRDFEVVVLKFYLDSQGRAYGLTAHPDKAALQREKRRRRMAAEGKDGVL